MGGLNAAAGVHHLLQTATHASAAARSMAYMMFRLVLSLALAAGFGGAAAQAADPLNTPQCRAARTRLDVATAAATGRSDASARALQAARERVANTCFGRAADSAHNPGDSAGSGLRAPQPAVAVPPVAGAAAAPSLSPPAPSPAPLPPPLALPRAAVITQCDPTGCWDSSGRRLNRVGPGLAGPGGPCTVQGNSAMCP